MHRTKGEWGLGERHQVLAVDSDQLNAGYFIAICEGPEKNANAAYIAACANACSGYTYTPQLCEIARMGGFSEIIKNLTNELFYAKTGRDALLSALKYHQEQTRPIQATIDLIAKCEAK